MDMPGSSCEGPSSERLLVRPGRRPKLNANTRLWTLKNNIDNPITNSLSSFPQIVEHLPKERSDVLLEIDRRRLGNPAIAPRPAVVA
jgi:hypothetical protein